MDEGGGEGEGEESRIRGIVLRCNFLEGNVRRIGYQLRLSMAYVCMSRTNEMKRPGNNNGVGITIEAQDSKVTIAKAVCSYATIAKRRNGMQEQFLPPILSDPNLNSSKYEHLIITILSARFVCRSII